MFPGSTATIHTNDVGEPIGWDYPDHDYWADDTDFGFDEIMVCETHQGFTNECPDSCLGDNLSHEDEWCCGPHGCCSSCCGTDEDSIRGSWHEGCDIRA